MADKSKLVDALINYVEMPGRQLNAFFGAKPKANSLAAAKALKQMGGDVLGSIQSAYTAPARALSGQLRPQLMMDENGNLVQDETNMANEAGNFALNFMGSSSLPALNNPMQHGSLGITAWHGSPAKFEKFDTKFAKTGAGAEQYGPGAYLSEGIELAKGYQPRSDAFENAISKLSERAYHTNNYVDADIYDNFLIHRTPEEVKSIIDEMYQGPEAIKANQALKQAEQLYKTKSKGGLYKVDLPDEHLPYFVDWNNPISSQSSHIQDIAKKYNIPLSEKGETLISAAGGINEAPNALMPYGVKGVKYFDTTSPGAGQGTSNYVVYDPEILSILERNSVPIKK